MISLSLNGTPSETRQVLCLGCHSDDIEIGCGGTILRLAMEHPDWVFHWVVFSAIGPRAAEARKAAARFLDPSRLRGPVLHSFQDGFMPFVGAEIKAAFEALKKTVSPDLIFTHNRNDAHQDHRLIAELTRNTLDLAVCHQRPNTRAICRAVNLYRSNTSHGCDCTGGGRE
jgi:LmbE family N-acetylglucosaminyl deacetylase